MHQTPSALRSRNAKAAQREFQTFRGRPPFVSSGAIRTASPMTLFMRTTSIEQKDLNSPRLTGKSRASMNQTPQRNRDTRNVPVSRSQSAVSMRSPNPGDPPISQYPHPKPFRTGSTLVSDSLSYNPVNNSLSFRSRSVDVSEKKTPQRERTLNSTPNNNLQRLQDRASKSLFLSKEDVEKKRSSIIRKRREEHEHRICTKLIESSPPQEERKLFPFPSTKECFEPFLTCTLACTIDLVRSFCTDDTREKLHRALQVSQPIFENERNRITCRIRVITLQWADFVSALEHADQDDTHHFLRLLCAVRCPSAEELHSFVENTTWIPVARYLFYEQYFLANTVKMRCQNPLTKQSKNLIQDQYDKVVSCRSFISLVPPKVVETVLDWIKVELLT